MANKKGNVYEEYINNVKTMFEKYGSNIIVLIQIGSFYECYSSPTCPGSDFMVNECARILNMDIGLHPKPEKLQMKGCGFPCTTYEEHSATLLQNGFTIVRYDQDGKKERVQKRKLGIVETPGTFLESTHLTNILMVINIKSYETATNKRLSIGASTTDLRTGVCSIFEAHSPALNYYYPIEELYRFLISNQPVELRIYSDISDEMKKYISQSLELDKYNVVWQVPEKDVLTVEYQNDFLEKLNKTSLSSLNLSRYQMAANAYIIMLKYIHEYHSTTLNKIKTPQMEVNHLILANNAIKQLRLIEEKSSLFKYIDKTKTVMGKRLLKYRLLHPFISVSEITKRHDYIDIVKSSSVEIDKQLENVRDLETLYRKIVLGKLKVESFIAIYESHQSIMEIINQIPQVVDRFEKFGKDGKAVLKLMKKVVGEYLEVLDIEKMSKSGCSFFKSDYSEEIDKLEKENETCSAVFTKYTEKLNKLIKNKSSIRLEYNTVDLWHLVSTVKQSSVLKEHVQIKTYKSKVKLFNDELNEASKKKDEIMTQMEPLLEKTYNKFLIEWYNKNEEFLENMNLLISEIDLANCFYKIATKYRYNKPKVVESEYGFIQAKDARNPYIERMIAKEYIPNDIDIGKDVKGLMLFGPNMAGKSTYMRMVALNTILAQMGSYVPAAKFKFSPYKYLVTRIMGEDDEQRGASSFMVEMSEIRIMIKCASPYTLALGDEICRGTGHYDALSLVSSTIRQMAKSESSFIFTTHLHDLNNRDEITSLKSVVFKHLSIESISDNEAKYDRKFKDGSGPTNYGIEIAKCIGLGEEFITDAMSVRNELEEVSLISTKKSRYNSQVRKTECTECGSKNNLETHHIKEQALADENGFIDHRHKNHASNLKVLCKKCHLKYTLEFQKSQKNAKKSNNDDDGPEDSDSYDSEHP